MGRVVLITILEALMIFVFGSNLAGRHGKGAALYAKQHHGAICGQGEGLQGDSYAIPLLSTFLSLIYITWIAATWRSWFSPLAGVGIWSLATVLAVVRDWVCFNG